MSTPNSKILTVAGVATAASVLAGAAWWYSSRGARKGDDVPVTPSTTATSTTVGRSVPEASAPAAPVQHVPGEPKLAESERATAMELLSVLKQRANVAFQEGRYEDAIRGYQDCISVTSALGSRDTEAVTAEQVIRSNVVMALIKLHQYEDARLVATMLLQDGETPLTGDLQVKVLYRRGMASKALGDREAAVSDFNAAIQLSPGQKNPAAEKELTLLKRTL